ncbi:MAG: glycolate oxidase subunit GlcE [Variovorax paradoxus]|uniref:Glycolate oxidase subunit GlcE n=1 Tax=Variovorax paradoxus TaxID=34073 RepID=A0A2W5QL04_VARPD|nr:MAG: glycolate oxidase subunit GlcE [Variovorax paradoxus]
MQLQPFMDRIRQAADRRAPLVVRGGGSKDFYGAAGAGEVLDTTPLAGVLSYEPSELVITVGAGTALAELEAVLAEQRQCLPFEPPHFAHVEGAGRATVGGMVAAGLSGPSRASVGCVRDYVLGAAIVNGRGEHLRFGGTVMKNVAGYDVSRVLAGSMGQLGLITEVSLKVLPVAPAEATLAFACTQPEALTLLNGWGGQPWPLNASAWQAQGTDGPGTLWLRLRGAVAAVESACRHLGGERCVHAHAADDWNALRDQRLPFFTQALAQGLALWRVSLPQTAPVLALPGQPLVEWHGGLRWYALPVDAAEAVRAAARAVGGHATLFRAPSASGAGAAGRFASHAVPRFDAPSPTLARIQQALRERFDPAGVFNPGRLLA